MSFELRLKRLKQKWMEIQKMRDEKFKQQKIKKRAESEVRRLSQEIPKKLNEYNEMMV